MGRDIEDFAIITGLVVVGWMVYQQYFPKKSLEEIIAELDQGIQGILGSIKLPTLPPLPMPMIPPQPQMQQAAASPSPAVPEAAPNIPITPTEPAAMATNSVPDESEPEIKEPPVKPKGSGQLAKNPTVSAPPPSSGGAIVAFAGDFDTNAKAKQTVQIMEKNNVSMIIGAGDYSYGPGAQQWFDQIIGARYKGKMIGAQGNHDNNSYLAVFGMSKWVDAFKVAPNLAVVTIDTESSVNAAELEAATAKAKGMAKHVAYVFHKPYITSSNGHHKGSENKSGSTIDSVAKKHGVKLIVAGHNHIYEHFTCGGIHYVTSGAAGRKFYAGNCQGSCSPVKCAENTNGFLKVSVGASLLCQFITHSGQIQDSFTIT